MKTMTRTLALVLVIALAFSLTTAFAASYDDYTDAADASSSDYAEAVDFCVALGIINGMSKTELGLDGDLTRAQAAKIVTYCLLGKTDAEALAASSTKFTDCNGHWALKYIAYCASEGIIDGYNETTFGPNDTLEGYQFAKMLLTALGYGKENRIIDGTTYVVNNYVGEYWATKVSSDGNKIDLFDKLDDVDLNGKITRAEAMQMAFNAYQVSLGYVDGYSYISDFSDGYFYTTRNYRLEDGDYDYLGRPAHYWVDKNGDAVTGTYASKATLTFVYPQWNQNTGEYSPEDIVDFLADQDEMNTYMKDDGTAKKGYSFPEKGILANSSLDYAFAGYEIEVYVDDDDVVTAYVVPYMLFKVTDTDENAKAKDEDDWTRKATAEFWYNSEMEITVYDKAYEEEPICANVGDFEEDDYVIGTISGLQSDTNLNVVAEAAKSITGTVTAVNAEKGYIKVDGKLYYVDAFVQDNIGSDLDTTDEAVFYLNNGYIVGYSDIKSDRVSTFLYVEDAQYKCESTSFSNDVYIKLDVVFTNGDNKVIQLPVTKKTGDYAVPGSEDTVNAKYYYVFDGTKYAFESADKTTLSIILKDGGDWNLAIAGGWYGYTVSDDGTYKLFPVKNADGQYVYDGVKFADKNAEVRFESYNAQSTSGWDDALATSATTVSFIDKDYAVTTVKGYKNFDADDTYVAEGDSNNILVVYNLDKNDNISDINAVYVFNARENNTVTDYVYANGFVEKNGSDYMYGFFEDGKYVEYVGAGLDDVMNGWIYTLDVNSDNEFTADDPSGQDTYVAFEAIVKSVSDGYIKWAADEADYDAGNTDVAYITNDTSIYDITGDDNAITTGSFAAKQVVTFVAEYNSDNYTWEIVDAYVLADKYVDYDFTSVER